MALSQAVNLAFVQLPPHPNLDVGVVTRACARCDQACLARGFRKLHYGKYFSLAELLLVCLVVAERRDYCLERNAPRPDCYLLHAIQEVCQPAYAVQLEVLL